jgi:hypothetical protein
MMHTPEPWRVDIVSGTIIFDKEKIQGLEVIITIPTEAQGGVKKAQANAARIVACVNACAGMEDPAAEIALLTERLKNAQEELVYLRAANDNYKADADRLASALSLYSEGYGCTFQARMEQARAALAAHEEGKNG